MSTFEFITKHTLLFGIIIIIGYIIYQIIVYKDKPKKEDKQDTKPEIKDDKKDDSKPKEEIKDNPLKRTARGFGVMINKIQNSDFVKNINEQNKNANPDDWFPKELKNNNPSNII